MTAEVLVELDQESLGYGDQVIIRDVSLSLHAGERIALLGESGVGKSTLLAALRPRLGQQAAWCPQHHGLVGPLSVYLNIYMGRLDQHSALVNLWNLARPLPRAWQEIAELCGPLGLEGMMKRSVSRLSGGQRQRVAIGRALHQQRDIFLGDEPVASVDPHQALALLELIDQRHRGSIIALHQRELALTHFDRVWGLADGRLVLDAPSNRLSLADLDALYPSAVASLQESTTVQAQEKSATPESSLRCHRGRS